GARREPLVARDERVLDAGRRGGGHASDARASRRPSSLSGLGPPRATTRGRSYRRRCDTSATEVRRNRNFLSTRIVIAYGDEAAPPPLHGRPVGHAVGGR